MAKYKNDKIDIVFLWCDLNDPAFRAKRAKALAECGIVVKEGDNGACRYESHDELRYALRSVSKFLPWIRKVHIVVDDDISLPAWLDTSARRLAVHRWGEIMPKELLPSFNSSAMDFFLQDIPDLAERFLYANDDMLVARTLAPSFFFARDGYPVFRYSKSALDMECAEIEDGFKHRVRNAFFFARDNFGILNGYEKAYGTLGHHNIDAYLKSDLALFREKFPEAWRAHVSHRFRDRSQLQREVLHGFAFSLGHAHYRQIRRPWYETLFGLPHRDSWHAIPVKDNLEKEFARIKPALVCINDSPAVTPEGREAAARFLEHHWGERGEFEK